MPRTPRPAFEPYEESEDGLANLAPVDPVPPAAPGASARLTAFYLSRDRVLGLLNAERLPAHLLAALQGQDVVMSSAILSNAVGAYLLNAIAAGGVKTLQQLAFEGNLRPGVQFIYDGHVSGKGFAYANKSPALTLTEKLDEPLAGKKLVFEFSKNGLVNDTAYTRMSGSTHLFAYGYVAGIDDATIRAVPYVVGDLVDRSAGLPSPFLPTLELRPEEIAQFAGMDDDWMPSKAEFERMRQVPEHAVKELLCGLLGEYTVPSDWGGEESDVFSANLTVDAKRHTGAFLLKGPARFHAMKPTDLGKNGDQLYRLFNIPAQIYVVQHCHAIGAAVRKQAEAFALARTFVSPCRIVFMDGLATARLLRVHDQWPAPATPRRRRP
ncbi:methyltransferase [Methylibium rhizosphaerae]|uniref:methyltransferase n=1 Tax=Methylibium rhizosphaerae TaxID=2570323 RepID=UPI001C615FCB|nr:methyltransferase [Methylibium rhizosphaerae]